MSTFQKIKTTLSTIFRGNWYSLRRGVIWPEGEYKRGMLKRLQKRYGCTYFVETGTFQAKTPLALRHMFKHIYTIELDPNLFSRAKTKLSPFENVSCMQGDSKDLMAFIVQKLDAPAIFWLDGHYSGAGTAKGAIAAPILQELDAIGKSSCKEHIIVIDDSSDFTHADGNASLSEVLSAIEKINPKYKVYFDYDMLFALPHEHEHREFWRKIAYPFVIR
jgi:hypothetical protein